MNTSATRHAAAIGLVLTAGLLLLPNPARAGNPRGASYCADHTRLFWFVQISDPHIGASGSTDSNRLSWIVTTGRAVVNPSFIVATGDLTDSTNGNWLGYPNGPYQAEWDQYKGILSAAAAGPDVFYDLPGNHDAYSDRYFAYYLANSVQGRVTGKTQLSWTRVLPQGGGKYHFLGVNSSDNTGAAFSLSWPYGDHAGLDATELAFIESELAANADANLTLVFGHHPVTDTGASDDTWLFYGHQQFVAALDAYGASSYGYGHTHDASSSLFAGNSYTGTMANGGVHYLNVASLGKSGASNYALFAIDCDGLSAGIQTVGTWPAVLVTAPTSARIGASVNPYAYTVPAVAGNPVRALVFDAAVVSQVRFRVDGSATWWPMERAASSSPIWAGTWDASAVAAGLHTLEVQAVGTTTRSHTISVAVERTSNRAPVAANDAYTVTNTLSVAAPGVLGNDSDPDGNALTAHLTSGAIHGVITLAADGGFTYAPEAGFSGADSFTYVALDGALASAPATVSLAVTGTSADVVTITSVTYAAKRKLLTVKATSSRQPAATLTVSGPDGTYGPMTWQAKTKTYVLTKTLPSAPASIVVTSDLGGTARWP